MKSLWSSSGSSAIWRTTLSSAVDVYMAVGGGGVQVSYDPRIRGEVDGCMPEVSWEQVSPKSFRSGLTVEVMPGVGHFPQLENPQWISERLVGWIKQHSA